MKYSEYKSKTGPRSKAAFYTVIACCLLALGGASWFAASSISRRGAATPDSPQTSSKEPQVSSEQSSLLPEAPAEEAGKSVSDEPYTAASNPSPATPEVTVYTMPVQGEVIKGFSDTELQYSETYKDMRIHTGVDIACEKGTAVSACADGRVINVAETASSGITVEIDHGNGITTRYSAIEGVRVKSGDSVSAGDIIGTVAEIPCECADESHLHLEAVKNGEPTDPMKALGFK